MSDSTATKADRKAEVDKLIESARKYGKAKGLPLQAHNSNRWAKRIKGKLHYFGKVSTDPKGEEALKVWASQKDDLLAGRKPRTTGDGLTVEGLRNRFLDQKATQLKDGELAQRTYDRYEASADLLVATFGKSRLVDDLRPEDFQELRSLMAKRWGAIALANEIQMVRTAFKFAYEATLIERPVRFGPSFKKPTAKKMREARVASGPKLFTAAQVKACLKVASPNLKAMILLGLNAGLGNTDLGMLTPAAIDLPHGWLDYPRQKTAMPRRVPLWRETVAAIRAVLKSRRSPADPADDALLFIGARGENYVGQHKGYRVTQEFAHVLAAAKVTGRSFYDLRRTFQTVACNGSRDKDAVKAIMGHAPESGDMSAIYQQSIEDTRLLDVVNVVRMWLYGSAA